MTTESTALQVNVSTEHVGERKTGREGFIYHVDVTFPTGQKNSLSKMSIIEDKAEALKEAMLVAGELSLIYYEDDEDAFMKLIDKYGLTKLTERNPPQLTLVPPETIQ